MRISNNADFIGATWEPYMETKPWLLSSLDVQTTPRFVYVQFRDASGTIQKSYFDDILFDPNMPSGEILVSDDVSGVNFQHTDFIPSGVSSNDLSLPGGIPVLQAEPDGSVLIYMKGYDDNSGLSEIQLSAESSFTDDEWQPFTTAMTWVPPAGDGLKTVYARMRDSAGNIGQSISMDFIYDSQPPQGGIQLEETVINAQTVEVTAHLIAFDGLFDDAFPESPAGWYEGVVQDMRIGFDPDFVDVSWQPFSENINIPIVSNSWERTIYVQYRDWAGNISEVYSATYTVDYIPPVVSATVSDGESLTRTINLKAHDNAAGIHNLRLSNDPMMSRDVLESDFTETISWDFNAERTAWIQVSDRVGNWSEPYPLYASLSDTNSCVVQETQYYSEVYGTVSITGVNAPVGTVVQAISPRDETVGCFTVTEEGNYGVMRIYGEDLLANPAIPGMHDGELVVFKVNGSPATATPLLGWSNDQVSHNVNLNAGENVFGENVFLPLIIR